MPRKAIDISGRKFGKWNAIDRAPSQVTSNDNKVRDALWNCKCDCGMVGVVSGAELRHGYSTQCKCCAVVELTRHGLTHTSVWNTWRNMRSRCENPKDSGYGNYGARGIKVCDEWQSFDAFYKDMGPKPTPRHSIERKNGSLGYFKDNCVWATQKEQMNNMRRNMMIEFNGKTLTLSQWCDMLSIPYNRTRLRIYKGWSASDAFLKPECNK